MLGQLQGHRQADRHAVGRTPGRDFGLEQKQFGRAPAQGPGPDLPQPGVHPRRIGPQQRPGFRLQRLDGTRRMAAEIQAPQQVVDFQRRGAEKFREPALRGAPQHQHLPQPILRMGEAEAEQHIGIGLSENVGNGGGVAHDLDRGRQPIDDPIGVVVRDRPGRHPEQKGDGDGGQRHRRADRTREPSQKNAHDPSSRIAPWAFILDGAGRNCKAAYQGTMRA